MRVSVPWLERAYTPLAAVGTPMVTHGGSNVASAENPTFWNPSAWKVATNSRELPGPNVAVVLAWAPLIVRRPEPTAAVPPVQGDELPDVHPAGKALPVNSAISAGLRITSPSETSDAVVFVSNVPAEKSATVVSVKLAGSPPVVKLHVASAPSGLPATS